MVDESSWGKSIPPSEALAKSALRALRRGFRALGIMG